MASDWATLKTHEILYRSNNMADCYDRVAKALREARAEGMREAAKVVKEFGATCRPLWIEGQILLRASKVEAGEINEPNQD